MGQLGAKLRLHAAMLNICLNSSDVLLLYPRSRARRCGPNQSCSNIWNTASFHWSIFAPSLKSQDSPVNFLKWAFFIFFLWEWKRLDWDLFKWRIPSLGCGGVSGTQVLVYHLTSGIFQLLSHQGQHFHVEKKITNANAIKLKKKKKRFLTKKLEDCSNILTDMHQITDMH